MKWERRRMRLSTSHEPNALYALRARLVDINALNRSFGGVVGVPIPAAPTVCFIHCEDLFHVTVYQNLEKGKQTQQKIKAADFGYHS